MTNSILTLSEIVENIEQGRTVSNEDLSAAVLAYKAMFDFNHKKLKSLLSKDGSTKEIMESLNMYKRALKTKPGFFKIKGDEQ